MKKYPIVVFLILLLQTVAFASSPPADWWGKVTVINGISNGATVSAYINGELRSTAVVGALKSDYYLIHVEGQSNDTVYFKVNGYDVSEQPQNWSAGDHPELNLTITIPNTPGDNQQKSGGGGGGGGTSDVPGKNKSIETKIVPITKAKPENTKIAGNRSVENASENEIVSQLSESDSIDTIPTGRITSNTSMIGGLVVLLIILIGVAIKYRKR